MRPGSNRWSLHTVAVFPCFVSTTIAAIRGLATMNVALIIEREQHGKTGYVLVANAAYSASMPQSLRDLLAAHGDDNSNALFAFLSWTHERALAPSFDDEGAMHPLNWVTSELCGIDDIVPYLGTVRGVDCLRVDGRVVSVYDE